MSRALSDDALALAGVGVAHHFGGGAYIKETLIPPGAMLTQHAHDHDHLSYLVSGTATLHIEGEAPLPLVGPTALTVKAHQQHAVEAHTAVLWLCVWATDCTDPAKVDEAIGGA